MVKKRIVLIIILMCVLIVSLFVFTRKTAAPAHNNVKQTTNIRPTNTTPTSKPVTIKPIETFNKTAYSIVEPGSLWWIVNKQHPAGSTYYPIDLTVPNIPIRPSAGYDERRVRKDASIALEKLVEAGNSDGVHLMLASGYRSYQTQISVYSNEVKLYGQAQADRESARPGTSEHQTGWAADLEDANRTCEVTDCFGNLPEGKWLAANAYKFGFIIRYTQDKENITGYRYEPWHIRYIGTDLSNKMHTNAIETLEEFFNNN